MLNIHTLNVGLGDSLILETRIGSVYRYSIIDCKKVGNRTPTVEYLEKNGVRHIECLFLSHLHLDHSSGIPGLVEYIKSVSGTLEYFVSPQLPEEMDIWNWLTEQHDKTQRPQVDKVIRALGDLEGVPSLCHDNRKTFFAKMNFEGDKSENAWRSHFHPGLIFAPVGPNPMETIKGLKSAIKNDDFSRPELNRISHATMVGYRVEGLLNIGLFTGDLDSKEWRMIKNSCLSITDRGIRTQLKFLKWPHHGKFFYDATTILKEIISPDNNFFVSISCPPGDPKHPDKRTLDILKNEFPNSRIACTSLSKHCNSPSNQSIVRFFQDRSPQEQEFIDIVRTHPHEKLLSDGDEACAGDHTFSIHKAGYKLTRAAMENCVYVDRSLYWE
jgi:hypothetical protein